MIYALQLHRNALRLKLEKAVLYFGIFNVPEHKRKKLFIFIATSICNKAEGALL